MHALCCFAILNRLSCCHNFTLHTFCLCFVSLLAFLIRNLHSHRIARRGQTNWRRCCCCPCCCSCNCCIFYLCVLQLQRSQMKAQWKFSIKTFYTLTLVAILVSAFFLFGSLCLPRNLSLSLSAAFKRSLAGKIFLLLFALFFRFFFQFLMQFPRLTALFAASPGCCFCCCPVLYSIYLHGHTHTHTPTTNIYTQTATDRYKQNMHTICIAMFLCICSTLSVSLALRIFASVSVSISVALLCFVSCCSHKFKLLLSLLFVLLLLLVLNVVVVVVVVACHVHFFKSVGSCGCLRRRHQVVVASHWTWLCVAATRCCTCTASICSSTFVMRPRLVHFLHYAKCKLPARQINETKLKNVMK